MTKITFFVVLFSILSMRSYANFDDTPTASGATGYARGNDAVLARGLKPRASGDPKGRPLTEVIHISERIFNNECGNKISSLIIWNDGESFPSLGIGHFIWYPEGARWPFAESFPLLLSFLEQKGTVLPVWIQSLPTRHAPWKRREDFFRDLERGQLEELRNFLVATKELQAEFMAERFRQSISKIVRAASPAIRVDIKQKLTFMIQAEQGLYPFIDYVNFNGEGVLKSERYKGKGWGLLQVLEEMKMPRQNDEAVAEFMRGAERILRRRVANSPPERNEQRWLPGWENRVHTYGVVYGDDETGVDYRLRERLLPAISEIARVTSDVDDVNVRE
jgi:hypothetical protein